MVDLVEVNPWVLFEQSVPCRCTYCILKEPQIHPQMARTEENGTRTFIDGTVLQMVEIAQPHGLSRTGYINYLIQLGLAAEAKNYRLSKADSEEVAS